MLLAWCLGRTWSYAPNRLVEDALQVALCQGRAFEVLLRLDLFGNHDCLLILNGRHFLLSERLLGVLVISQIELCANKDDGHARRMMVNLWVPLISVRCILHLPLRGIYLRLDVVE